MPMLPKLCTCEGNTLPINAKWWGVNLGSGCTVSVVCSGRATEDMLLAKADTGRTPLAYSTNELQVAWPFSMVTLMCKRMIVAESHPGTSPSCCHTHQPCHQLQQLCH
mmetsp:Transcript_96473/g.191119  ORF Transcript_96473/g.191119 Transcript_96473/m.191119 type:complete len:108 (+) Transcript_96473:1126-1449(+)